MGMSNHLISMKSGITTLLLAVGLFNTGALADPSPAAAPAAPAAMASRTPAPDQITDPSHLPGVTELYGTGAEPGPAGQPGIPSRNDPAFRPQAADGQVIAFSYHVHVAPDNVPFLLPAPAPTVVYSMPTSPVFDRGPRDPAFWGPSVSFRFDFGRRHRS
jgi:hypothetical protein